jgi:4-hydroxy-tetrahydrodipicolinate synthase
MHPASEHILFTQDAATHQAAAHPASRFHGTGTALVTPFKADGSIDFPALGALIDFQLAGGVEFLVACGSTGESATMTAEEDRSVIRYTIERVAGRVPVVAGTGSNNTAEAVEYSRHAQALGADGVLVVTPYYNKPTPRGIIRHYETISNAVDIPIIIYNVPGRTGTNMTAETQVAVMEACPNVVATKEASGNLDQMMEIIRTKPTRCSVLSGDDSLAVPLVAVGGSGVISVLSNYAPRLFSDCIRAALSNDFPTARKIQYTLLELMKLNFIESNPIPVKAALSLMGIIDNHLRLPLVPLSPVHLDLLKQALQRSGLLASADSFKHAS